jgi:hypothetical protein
MSNHFLVLHFEGQCPWQPWVTEQARMAAGRLGGTLEVVDAAQRPDLAARYRLYFPFLTLIDGTIRIPAPTPAGELVRIAKEGTIPVSLAYVDKKAPAGRGTVIPLTPANLNSTCHLCVPSPEKGDCMAKSAWAAAIARDVPDGVIGFASCVEGQAVGAVEFLPSELVPYALPVKDPGIAFITCLYSLEDGLDYRGQVLESLLECLGRKGYKEVQVISGKRLPYPNGPEAFFTPYGFQLAAVLGEISTREGEDEIVLLRSEV